MVLIVLVVRVSSRKSVDLLAVVILVALIVRVFLRKSVD